MVAYGFKLWLNRCGWRYVYDRKGAAKELHDLLVAAGVKVWFSENDLGLGVPMMRAIDKGLANSRIGLVLVTPAMLKRLPQESVAYSHTFT
ncbi:toll/interleukin-1 receptor domain-containing protein [Aliidiomarina haloalkalitolerans]|uniref:toll/interleukin-1 receptor domain-containing protein n=1 Tax=Aliidiomarina haloalkalitolerans TaxID=859059 RepID=UPI0018E562B1|nr:toll/interleukin-1 receptor domain-containing protein [Aliidiomarina haloalkalitolerans]